MKGQVSPQFKRAVEAELNRLLEQQDDFMMKQIAAIRSGQLTVQDVQNLRQHKVGAFRMNGNRPVGQPSFTSANKNQVQQYADKHSKPPRFIYKVMKLGPGHTRWHTGKRQMFGVY